MNPAAEVRPRAVKNNISMKQVFITAVLAVFTALAAAQSQSTAIFSDGKVQFSFNSDASRYVRITGLNQVWLRHTELNPGTTLYGSPLSSISDIGIRRLRFQVYGQLTDRVFFYTQFGQNNFSFRSPQYTGAFFHDAVTELRVHEDHLSMGAGLTGWSGLLRYASPAVGSILTLDAPLYQQATNGVNDQFLRKLSVYAKGKLGGLDYRVAVSRPMAVQNSPAGAFESISAGRTSFSTTPAKLQYQGYVMYQFLDRESNLIPYNTGTYIGKKKVLNVGAGFIQQSGAMWRLNAAGDTAASDMLLLGADVFYDTPLNGGKGTALTLYAAYSYYDFGANYFRNIGVMNPTTGVNAGGTVNGTGNNLPMIGTGSTLYLQGGFAFGNNIVTEGGKLQPYAAAQYSLYEALDEPMLMAEGGMNWFIHGDHNSKVSLNYQSRPVFDLNATGEVVEISRRGMVQLQYQLAF